MDEAGKMNKMVKQLLTLTALEFGNDMPVMERFDITALIRGILASAGILLQQKEARVVFEQKEPVWVWADEFKIEEVITNYLNNAMNHLDGERQITISIFREGDQVRITVFNTGQHIPEEDLDNLWTKFYKVDKARTGNTEAAASDFPLSRQSWIHTTNPAVLKMWTGGWSSGLQWTAGYKNGLKYSILQFFLTIWKCA